MDDRARFNRWAVENISPGMAHVCWLAWQAGSEGRDTYAALLDRAISAMSALHNGIEPDEDGPNIDALIPGPVIRAFVDEHAALLFERARLAATPAVCDPVQVEAGPAGTVLSEAQVRAFAARNLFGLQAATAQVREVESAVLAAALASQPQAGDVRDAARYRWLREECRRCGGEVTIARFGAFGLVPWAGDDPDSAIDAAMRGGDGGRG